MRKPIPRRKAVGGAALTLVTFAIGLLLAVLVAGSASAKTSPKASPKKTTKTSSVDSFTTTTMSPADKFSAINGTANAASDHEIVGSSAFPNFTTGAVDNYYTMAHAHIDNSPFAEGTASPFDTGPVGQTAAAGNFQQPQYADARWPGGPVQATYGNQGGPDAKAVADNNRANADASEATNTMSAPGMHGTKTLAVPKGFDAALQKALGTWNAKWDGPLGVKKPTPPAAAPRTPVTVPSSPVKPPSVTTPQLPVGGVAPTPPVKAPKLPSAGAMGATRSPASFTVPRPPASLPKSRPPAAGGTESGLSSSTLATLVYKTGKSTADTSKDNTCKSDTVATTGTGGTTGTTPTTTTTEKPKSGTCTLVLSGESSVGRVSLGGGQIVIDGIHVTASITNDGTTPSYNAAVTVASATIGGIPVTIDKNGVHVAGHGQGLPYQQASAGLNSALNKAGIQIFLVAPEVTNCGQSGGSSTGGGTSTTSTTTSTDQSGGSSSSCGGQSAMSSSSCDQSGSSSGSGGPPGVPAPPTPAPTSTQSSTTPQSSPCGQTGDMGASCDQTGTGTGGTSTGTTTTTAAPGLGPSTTTTTSSSTTPGYQSSTTTTPGSCGESGMTPPPSSCTKAGTASGTSTGSFDQSATTTSTDSTSPTSGGTFQFGPGPGTNNAGEETVTATGVHIVFTQPVSPSGVPAQYVEHIIGEVFVDSLATPAAPLPSGGLGFSSSSLSSSPSSSSSCLGAAHSGSRASGSGLSASGGGSSLASSASSGGIASGSGSPAASALGASSQPSAGSTGSSLPASFAHALHKPLWLLLAYLVWQALVVGTGWSLWRWRRGGTT